MTEIANEAKSRLWVIGLVLAALTVGLLVYFWQFKGSGQERVPIENERPASPAAAPASEWDDLIPESVSEPDFTQAESDLSFDLIQPSDKLGIPAQITVTDPKLVPADGQELGVQYQSDQYGLYWIMEYPTDATQEQLEALVSLCDPSAGCKGKWSIVTLGNGTRAVLVEDTAQTSIAWLQGGLRIEVTGPSDTLSADSALAVANQF